MRETAPRLTGACFGMKPMAQSPCVASASAGARRAEWAALERVDERVGRFLCAKVVARTESESITVKTMKRHVQDFTASLYTDLHELRVSGESNLTAAGAAASRLKPDKIG